jgi:hypothetical protein
MALGTPRAGLAQSIDDAKSLNARTFTAHLPGYRPEQVIDFFQAYLHYQFDHPDTGWRPLQLVARSDRQLRMRQDSRTWKSVNALEFDAFAEPDDQAGTAPATSLTLYFATVQNRNSSFEHRADITVAAGMYRVAKSMHENAEKLMPGLERLLSTINDHPTFSAPVMTPKNKFFIAPKRAGAVDEADRAYLARDIPTALRLLDQPELAKDPAALARLAYLSADAGPQRAGELALRALYADARSTLGYVLMNGVGTEANPKLGYAGLWISASSGDTDAMFALAMLHDRVEATAFKAEAYRLYRIAGELGHPVARTRAESLAAVVDETVRAKAEDEAKTWKKLGEALP